MKFQLLLTSLFLVLAACSETKKEGQKEQTDNQKTFTSEGLHFIISYPPNWEVKERESKVGILEPYKDSTDKFQENIVVWVEEMPLAISDSLYAKATLAELRIKNPTLTIQSFPSKKFGDHTFSYFEFDLPGDDRNYKVIGYTTVKDRRGYNFFCTYEASASGDYKTSFESIVSTFKPLP